MTTQQLRLWGLVVTVGAWLYMIAREILPAIGKVTEGFAAYYTAAFAILHGGAAELNNNALFAAWLPRSGIGIHEVYQGNTPTLGLLMIPLTLFSPSVAQTIWLAINVILLILCSWLAGRMLASNNAAARWWIAAVFAMLAPVRETIRFGQVYLLIALLILLTLYFLLRRRDSWAGAAVGAIGLFKAYYGVLALGLLVWTRRWRSMVGILVCTITVIIVTLPLLAPAWPSYFSAQIGIEDIAWAGIPANQTLNSALQHLFVYTAQWNPEPLINAQGFALILRYGTAILLVGVTLWRSAKHEPLWIWLPALILMPILAPVGEPHHYTLALLPIAAAVVQLTEFVRVKTEVDEAIVNVFIPAPLTPPRALLLLVGLILLITPYPSLRDASIWQGWHGLFAYPRLIGALLVWGAI